MAHNFGRSRIFLSGSPGNKEVEFEEVNVSNRLGGNPRFKLHMSVFNAHRVLNFPAAFIFQVLGFLLHEFLEIFQARHSRFFPRICARLYQTMIERLHFFGLELRIRKCHRKRT